MIRLAVAGAMGRMGRSVLELAAADARFETIAALVAAEDSQAGARLAVADLDFELIRELPERCEVLIDFTGPAGTMQWLAVCERRQVPMVIGTTGFDADQQRRIDEAAHNIPILQSANFSLGIGSILGFLGRLARDLGDDYDVEIVEAHHRRKVDAPSGTALLLADEIARALGRDLKRDAIYGRHGEVGPRGERQIGIHAVRMGDLVSEHDIHFSGPGETVTVRHVAHSRATYAAGALRGAHWLVQQGPGHYGLRDMLGQE